MTLYMREFDNTRQRADAIDWATDVIESNDHVIVEAEATRYSDKGELLRVFVYSTQGEVLLDALLKPMGSIASAATSYHRISRETIAKSPVYAEISDQLNSVLKNKRLICFNRNFIKSLFRQTAERYKVKEPKCKSWTGLSDYYWLFENSSANHIGTMTGHNGSSYDPIRECELMMTKIRELAAMTKPEIPVRAIASYDIDLENYTPGNHLFPMDRTEASLWAKNLLRNKLGWVVLDTEATSTSPSGPVIQVSVLSPEREVLFDSFVRPKTPASIDQHVLTSMQISLTDLDEAPDVTAVKEKLSAICKDKVVITFNRDYREKLMARCFGLNLRFYDCAMEMWSQFVGEWMESKMDYKWQKLPKPTQRWNSLDDCRTTLRLIEIMAAWHHAPETPKQKEGIVKQLINFFFGR